MLRNDDKLIKSDDIERTVRVEIPDANSDSVLDDLVKKKKKA